MGPAFKGAAVDIDHLAQICGAVGLLTRPKDQIVGPGHCVYAIDLHKVKMPHDALRRGAERWEAQAVTI